ERVAWRNPRKRVSAGGGSVAAARGGDNGSGGMDFAPAISKKAARAPPGGGGGRKERGGARATGRAGADRRGGGTGGGVAARAASVPVGPDADAQETREWLESLDAVLRTQGPDRARYLLEQLLEMAHRTGVNLPFTAKTPYINTISADEQPVFPGNREIERRI